MKTAPDAMFPLVTVDDAPEGSRATLAAVQKGWGFAPNLMRTFANSPAVVEGAWAILGAFDKTSFSPAERQLLMLAVSVENDCGYCAAAHSLMGKGAGLTVDQLQAVRSAKPLADARLEALRRYTTAVVAKRGFVDDAEIKDFLAAGFTQTQMLEVVLGVAAKTLMNYTDPVAHVVLDDAFKAHAWQPSLKQAA